MNKRIAILHLFLLLPVFLFSAWPEWSDPIRIEYGTTPDMDIDPRNGNIHMIVMNSKAIYIKADSVGNILEKEVVPGSENDEGGWHAGAIVSVDPEGNPHVCYRSITIRGTDWYYDLYYVRKVNGVWSGPVTLMTNEYRAYMADMDIDSDGRVHVIRSTKRTSDLWVPLTYYRIYNGEIESTQENVGVEGSVYNYRQDDRMVIKATDDGMVHLVMGCPYVPGTVSYYNIPAGETQFRFVAYLQASATASRNGSPDIFADSTQTLHFCYGALHDNGVNNEPAIRYVRYSNGAITQNYSLTQPGDIEYWTEGMKGIGYPSIATSDDGQYLVMAYPTKLGGSIYAYLSSNGGETWFKSGKLGDKFGEEEGRNKQIVRAYKNHFYLLSPVQDGGNNVVQLRIIRDAGDEPPVIQLDQTYSGNEGDSFLFDASGSYDPGQNPGIVSYAWDWENDGVVDETTTSPQVSHTYADDFSGQMKLTVTDRIGATDETTASVNIVNVTPAIDIGSDITANEGDELNFSVTINDPGAEDTFTISWQLGDGATETAQSFSHVYGDNGTYQVNCHVEDDDGGVKDAQITVTVQNVIPEAAINGSITGGMNEIMQFQAIVSDPGSNENLTCSWDLNNDGVYESSGMSVTFSRSQKGVYPIRLKVEDKDGGLGEDTKTIYISDGTPIILPIADQTINEGSSFPEINMNTQAADLETASSDLLWTITGNTELHVTVQNRIISIAPPNVEWSGTETLKFRVENALGLADSVQAVYTVVNVDDPPVWTDPMPNYSILEDDHVTIPLSFMRDRVNDIDDAISNLAFSMEVSSNFTWEINQTSQQLIINPIQNWFGTERMQFVVTDPSGESAKDTSWITVTNIPEEPVAFSLISPLWYEGASWPDSIVFIWHSSYDPDNTAFLYYNLIIEKQNDPLHLYRKTISTSDTSLTFKKDNIMSDGLFFWWVDAIDESDASKMSDNTGILAIDETGVDRYENTVPKEFDLLQNYPNPFNHSTFITYHLPEMSPVSLSIYNTTGQKIWHQTIGQQSPGVYTIHWNGQDLTGQTVPSGIYLYRLVAGKRIFDKKMMLLQ